MAQPGVVRATLGGAMGSRLMQGYPLSGTVSRTVHTNGSYIIMQPDDVVTISDTTVLTNNFEGGTAAATITTSDTGSGSAWTLTASVAGGTCVYSSTGATHGSLCMHVTTGATGGAERRGWPVNSTDSTAVQYFRFYIDPADVTGTVSPLRGMNVGSGGQRFRVQVAAGVVSLFNSANTSIWSSTALASGTKWRVEAAIGGTTSSTGQIQIFSGDSTTTSQDSGVLSAQNFGGPTREVWFGQTNSATNVALKIDDAGWSSDTWLGQAGAPSPLVSTGPIAGGLTDTGFAVTYWLSNAAGQNVRLVVSTNVGLTSPVFSSIVVPDSAGIVKLSASGLTADAQYYYGVEVAGAVLSGGRGQIRTDPTPGAPTNFSVAFGSCQWDAVTAVTFNAIRDRSGPYGQVRRLIHMGDINYQDWGVGATQSAITAFHKSSLGSSSMAGALTQIAMTYAWDNHDWGGTDSDKDSPAATVVAASHRQVYPSYNLPASDGKGIWNTWVIGRVRFIQIDPRSQRDNRTVTNGPTKTMLGVEQKAWLKARLQDPEPVKIICGNMYWRQDSSTGDRWGSYANEFTELNDFIDASAVGLVYVIFGDRHALCADDGTAAGTRGRPQAGGAPFQQGSTVSSEVWSQGYYHDDPNTIQTYGILDFQDTGSAITINYSGITSLDGVTRVAMTTVAASASAVTLTPAVMTASAPAITAVSGPMAVTLAPISRTLTAVPVTATPGAMSVTLTPAVQTTSAVAVSAASGATSVTLTPVTRTVSAVALTATPGATSVTLTPATQTMTATAVTATPNVTLTPITRAITAVPITAAAGATSVTLAPVTRTISAVPITATPGPTSVTLTPATVTASALSVAAVPGVVTVALTPAIITTTVFPLGVGGVSVVSLSAAVLATTAQPITATPGAVNVSLTPVVLNTTALSLSVTTGVININIVPAQATITPGSLSFTSVRIVNIVPAHFTISPIAPAIGVTTPGVDLMTIAFAIVTGVGEYIRGELEDTEGGVPRRFALIVPGNIAWDDCTCGQFAQSITSVASSRVFPTPATDLPVDACGHPLAVVSVTVSLLRCVQNMDDQGNPPTIDDLLAAARILEDDRQTLRRALNCYLSALRDQYRIMQYTIGVAQSVGPEGMCGGIEMTYSFGIPNDAMCCV